MAMIQEDDAQRNEAIQETMAIIAPAFDTPVPGRTYRVAVQMLSRVLSDLSDGQVEVEFDAPQGDIDRLPGPVFQAIAALEQYNVPGLEIDAMSIASSADEFAQLAAALADWRSNDGSRGRSANEPDPTAGLATEPEQRALADRDLAGGIADAITRRPAR